LNMGGYVSVENALILWTTFLTHLPLGFPPGIRCSMPVFDTDIGRVGLDGPPLEAFECKCLLGHKV